MVSVFNHLGRIITRGRRFMPEVDGLRFVAIAAVVLFHLSGNTLLKDMTGATIHPMESWLAKFFGIGQYGVQLFFVLSGFLLAIPFAKWRLGLGSKPSLRTYYFRRLTRLEPPYVVAMLLLFVGGIFALGAETGWSHWPNLLTSLVYQHNLVYGEPSLVASIAWSLEVEVQFYVVAPILAVVFSIRDVVARRATLLATMVAVPFLRSFVPAHFGETLNSLPWHLEFFLAGLLLADLYLVDWKEHPRLSYKWDVASLIGWPVFLTLMLWQRFSVLVAPVVLITYIGAFRGKLSSWLLSRPLITVTGGMCYSMYLLHCGVISVTGHVARRFPLGSGFITRFAVEALIGIPAVLAITIVFFVLLERPCMDPTWPSKVAKRVRSWFGDAVPQPGRPNLVEKNALQPSVDK